MLSSNKKSPSKKANNRNSSATGDSPLFAQLLPFANVMTEKVQLVNALAFTFIMGVSIFGIALWRLSALT